MPNQNYSCAWNQETTYYECPKSVQETNTHDYIYGPTSNKNSLMSSTNCGTYFESQNFLQDTEKFGKSCAISNDNIKMNNYDTCNSINMEINGGDLYKTSCLKEMQDVNNSYSYSYSCSLDNNYNKAESLKVSDINGIYLYGSNMIQQEMNSYEIYNQKYYDYNATYSNNYVSNEISQTFDYSNSTNVDVTDSESDIVVEESDDLVTDFNEDFERVVNYTTCFVCKTLYTGAHFHLITPNNPLTVTSQVPILTKIIEIVGSLEDKQYYMCNHCLGLINTIDQLQNKIEIYKNELVTNVCKSFNTSNVRKCTHLTDCTICNKNTYVRKLQKANLLNHKLKGNFLCELCGKCFLKYSRFKIHYKIHKVKTSNPIKKMIAFCCKVCKKPFRTRTHLKEHENYCTGKLPFKCTYVDCNKKFATPTKLKDHIKLKHEKKFTSICSICNIGFVKPSDYKSHMTTHSTEKKYHCTLCDKSYKTLSNLNFHMKYHNNKLPFVCDICNKGFMRKEYLESHLNMHKGIKNFACQLCDKKFVSQKNLDAHLKYHDGNMKKKSCDICGKFMSSGLEDHIRSHNNLKEFQCNVCNMKFNTKGALSKHKRRKHENT